MKIRLRILKGKQLYIEVNFVTDLPVYACVQRHSYIFNEEKQQQHKDNTRASYI